MSHLPYHASPRYLRQCSGKRRHSTEAGAYKARKAMVAHGVLTPEAAKNLKAYPCPFCRTYHLGNQSEWMQQLEGFAQYANRAEIRILRKFPVPTPEAMQLILSCREIIADYANLFR